VAVAAVVPVLPTSPFHGDLTTMSFRTLAPMGLLVLASVLMARPETAPSSQDPAAAAQDAPGAVKPLAHMVYFTLAEDTPENREALVAACSKYLSDHEGTIHFSVGIIGDEFARDVNDREFDIALNMIFRDKAAHDAYHSHPRHDEFVETSSQLWSSVRVFDSYVATPLRQRRGGQQRTR